MPKKRKKIDVEGMNKSPVKIDRKKKSGGKAARTLFNTKKDPQRKLS